MKVAFVAPWYGESIPGGAESETRRTAEQLVSAGIPVEILTTTIRDFFADWDNNHHQVGVEQINGVNVRRFPVQKRNKAAFDAVNYRLMNRLPISAYQEQIYLNEMVKSPQLIDYIKHNRADYLYFFIPYLFSTTYFGAQAAPERSYLIPCLHDESYARLPAFRQLFPQIKGMIFHVNAEKELADKLYPAPNGQLRPIFGEGVDTNWQGDAARFRAKYDIGGDFVLYVGKKDTGKNIPLLLEYWTQYTREVEQPPKLLLAGAGDLHLSSHLSKSVIDLGFIPNQDKYDAYTAAAIFCNPSLNESFSIVLMEAWLAETPALVHAHCDVTRTLCRQTNGGLYFANYPEFAGALTFLLDKPQLRKKMGTLGRRHVLANYRWEIIIAKYKALIEQERKSG